ncbi:P-loop containing nucleoside triphosphate hydrolase protein [Nemania abortiva]|nr:P-loop containing nucleoside triphosphate hydrolase protein [Nemania abortiva]
MLPVIFLLGSTSSGKGTLCARLAAEFNLHHISIGDTFRELSSVRWKPIPGMPDEINEFIVDKEAIPCSILHRHFDPAPIPVALQVHNRRVWGNYSINLCGPLLREKAAEITSKGGVLPHAIIIDGLHTACYNLQNATFEQMLQEFAPSYSGLTIRIECPHDVAKKRFLKRARWGDGDGEKFEERMRKHKRFTAKLLDFLALRGSVVTTVNDGTMTVEDAYQTLLTNLEGNPVWESIITRST